MLFLLFLLMIFLRPLFSRYKKISMLLPLISLIFPTTLNFSRFDDIHTTQLKYEMNFSPAFFINFTSTFQFYGSMEELQIQRKFNLIILRYAFVSSDAFFIKDNHIVLINRLCHPRIHDIVRSNNQFLVSRLEKCIVVGHQFTYAYGHFLNDAAPQLIFLNNYFLKKYTYIFSKLLSQKVIPIYILEALTLFTHSGAVLTPPFNQIFYVSKAITIQTLYCNTNNHFLIYLLNNFFLRKLNVTRHMNKMIFYNRPRFRARCFGNFEELLFLFRKYHSCWEDGNEIDKLSTLMEQASFWNSIQVLIASDGTGMANMIFMKNNSLVIEILHNKKNCGTFFVISRSLAINYIIYQDSFMNLLLKTPNVLSIVSLTRLNRIIVNFLNEENQIIN
ncbi:hypothetical protein TRFO_38955 [Tritrichomonas foetus]|uniref:Glycosyltransferase 61 catalytic domain-containing protein n=1 Tax=Tritrichomonas foetus TaxID=1144522 RepID=A0A1J4JB23_9EUKA|nr:hypothetical protein TRFO_38955 [Tritrichomonas foetus]|eukprot:OHS94851.1 hypothetical protein TRFO_38955 [Tritrichomonas foetus]